MLSQPIQPRTGPITIDVTTLIPMLVDLMPCTLRRLRTEERGIDATLAELEEGSLAIGAKARTSTNVRERHGGSHKRSSKSAATASLSKKSRRRSKRARRRTRTSKR